MKRFFIRFMGVLVALVGTRGAYAAEGIMEDVTAADISAGAAAGIKKFMLRNGTVYAYAFDMGDDMDRDTGSSSTPVICKPNTLYNKTNGLVHDVYVGLNCAETRQGVYTNKKKAWCIPRFSGSKALGCAGDWTNDSAASIYSCKWVTGLTSVPNSPMTTGENLLCCCAGDGFVCATSGETTTYMGTAACLDTGSSIMQNGKYGGYGSVDPTMPEKRYYTKAQGLSTGINGYVETQFKTEQIGGCKAGMYAHKNLVGVAYPESQWLAGTGFGDTLCEYACPSITDDEKTQRYGSAGHKVISDSLGLRIFYSGAGGVTGFASCYLTPVLTPDAVVQGGASSLKKLVTGTGDAGKFFYLVGTGCHS